MDETGESIECILCRIPFRAIGWQMSVPFNFCMAAADCKQCGDRLSLAAAGLGKNPAFVPLEQPHLVPESALVRRPAQQMEQTPYRFPTYEGEMLSPARYANQFQGRSRVVR